MGLFEEICSFNTLLLAFDRVEENGGSPGIDNVTIEEFSIDLKTRLLELRKQLLDGTYSSSPLRKVGIQKPDGKIRWLSIPTVKDRTIQTSAAMILSPILDAEFEECSFAYRKNKSVQKAVHKVIDLRDKGYTWVVDADIRSFFDEINHALLIEEIRKYIKEDRVIELIKKWLDADVVYKGEKTRLTKGLPQGSPISPLLSNLYLDSFDEALMEEKFRHVRFADDFVILCKDKPDAEDALELTEDVLKKLKLQLNAEETRIVHFNQGFRYLGMDFLRSMVYRPIYEDKSDSEQETALNDVSNDKERLRRTKPEITSKPADTVRKKKRHMNNAEQTTSELPDTVMAMALKKAMEGAEREDFDFLLEEKIEIEPTAYSDPFLRTLYLLEQGAVLRKEDERFVITKDDRAIKEIPLIKVDQILIFGNIQITTQAMKFCLEEDVPIILLSSSGKYFGTVESFKSVTIALHKKQFERNDDRKFALNIGRTIVRAKINNSKVLIQRYARKRKSLNLESEIHAINLLVDRLPSISNHEELMGIEGAASSRYFSAFRALIGEEWDFTKRKKNPPPDPVNSLLSYGYTLLFYNVYAMIRMHGLHPYVGLLHSIREGHPALVSDMMEEFRAPIVDAVVINLITRRSLKKEDFIIPEDERSLCLLRDNTRKIFIKAFEGKMNSSIAHEATGYQVDYRRCIDLQVQAMRKVIDGKLSEYKPMMIK
ncbi:MAG: group II intron reverse transcriptase/maturase [Nitrospirae bacterium]|nr:group II intron reverse transcriptase/maturase [Nitrospirota bacterium]